MRALTIRATVAAALVLGTAGAALARNSDSGSGLSPYAALNGNDRSAGINNGNYRQPRYDPYLRTYGRPPVEYYRAPPPAYYYGYPY
ncbi:MULTISPECIES: hypothetical protein [Methylobacterium]|uniref:Uncharacterized protein n=2 Tax=Methylobacterium TaxID=407 RepID=A0A0C6F1T8_9HYPH|nr:MULTISPECIES: hypothetical protein [Methylobacterium]MBK3398822.1 hypothetical protein [Methylobacterium ajmalii]MBK3422466.1 hypothetical protein [Methylobacterium ajmalii]MBZ6414684.1 hypothetical protein [Methylobacterium sp.]SFE32945.1 hypothetical protein SAMN04487844_102243 [Methylobacterium sp. yr596]BAQ46586.1 hypothetical protein Maq22A_c17345 [Methylobacterium aquaticum]